MTSFVTDPQLQSPPAHNESKESGDVEGTVADGEAITRKKKLGVGRSDTRWRTSKSWWLFRNGYNSTPAVYRGSSSRSLI